MLDRSTARHRTESIYRQDKFPQDTGGAFDKVSMGVHWIMRGAKSVVTFVRDITDCCVCGQEYRKGQLCLLT